jgi:hypothetical protein
MKISPSERMPLSMTKTIVDIKATAEEQPSWSIQCGAYQSMLDSPATEMRRDDDHRYFDGAGVEYRSVTGLIKDLGILPSWSGIGTDHPNIVHARERGKAIEAAIYSALQSDNPRQGVAPAKWGDELAKWWPGYLNWLDDCRPEYIDHQKFVADSSILVAGEYDLCVKWGNAKIEGNGVPCALHLNPKFQRGYRLRRYEKAKAQWALVAEARAESLNRFALTRAKLDRI